MQEQGGNPEMRIVAQKMLHEVCGLYEAHQELPMLNTASERERAKAWHNLAQRYYAFPDVAERIDELGTRMGIASRIRGREQGQREWAMCTLALYKKKLPEIF